MELDRLPTGFNVIVKISLGAKVNDLTINTVEWDLFEHVVSFPREVYARVHMGQGDLCFSQPTEECNISRLANL